MRSRRLPQILPCMSQRSPLRLRQLPGAGRGRHFTIELGALQVGQIVLTGLRHDFLLVDLEIDPPHQGQGLATVALALLCTLLAGLRPAPGLVVWVDVANGAAQRVLERNGFICSDVSSHPLLFELTAPARHP
jgi:RimJ/RimL family protein N-acetyltransferase